MVLLRFLSFSFFSLSYCDLVDFIALFLNNTLRLDFFSFSILMPNSKQMSRTANVGREDTNDTEETDQG